MTSSCQNNLSLKQRKHQESQGKPWLFCFSWEQRKLVSLCEKFTDGDWIESKDQSDSGVRLVQTGNVGVAEYLDKPNNKKWISTDTFDRLHCEEVLPGDILISRLPEPAGRACIMPFLGTKMITAVDCTIVRTAPDVSNKFLVQYLSSQAYFNEVNTCLAGGTRQRISRGNLADFDVPIPAEKPEQDAIGSFFSSLDNLITLHQRFEFSLSSAFRKYALSWEQRKLGDIFEEYSEKGHPELPALTIIQGCGTIRRDESDRSLQYDKASLANYKMVNDGDFIVHLRSFEGGLEKATTLGIISPAYHTFHGEGTDSRFYYSYFRSPKFIDQDLKPHVYGIRDGRSIDIEGMKTIEIPWTSFAEQKAIGDYIDALDNLITLHQREQKVTLL